MQQNIYFRKDVWEKFKDEENKSEVINMLLKDFYGQIKNPVNPFKSSLVVKDIPAPNATFEIKPSKERDSKGLCKIHGTPLDDRGKCLVKGCKNG